MAIGCKVTLRRKRMYEFIDRLVNIALPRTKDISCLSEKNFDVLGYYSPATHSHPNGSGATIDIVIPPIQGGHGYSAAAELNAKYAIVSAETTLPADDQAGIFSGPRNEIRQIGLLRNPLDSGTRTARGASYDMRTSLYITHPTSTIDLSEDEEIVGPTGKRLCGIYREQVEVSILQ